MTARLVGTLIVTVVVATIIATAWVHRHPRQQSSVRVTDQAPPHYAGSNTCVECHASEVAAWRNSQHAAAMAEATDRTVRGRFDSVHVTYAGVTSTFFRRQGKFYVKTDGPDGRLADFEIKYTFGVSPLQQYLIELPGGRLQSLGLAWDVRPSAAGGQRWFHLYGNATPRVGDALHWTGLDQNWNFMCADCHSTNVRKGYVAATREFHTTWSEISVGCEACHGPGSRHLAWARQSHTRESSATSSLMVQLDERRGVTWRIDRSTLLPSRSEPRAADREIEVCARCHARRSQLTDLVRAGDPLEDGFRPSLLEPSLYYVDGQQRDEVYDYGSFLQSKMYAKGVTCSDCHDPHTGGLLTPGNAVCTSCHLAGKYDAPAHYFHRAYSQAALCVTCHMPATTYMQVDQRHDHSLRVPRPDRTSRLGSPNPCTSACHRDKSAAWAENAIETRIGRAPAGFQRFAEVFHAVDLDSPGAFEGLNALLADGTEPAIVRASAFERMAANGVVPDSEAAARALLDRSPLVRRAVLEALEHADATTRVRLVPPSLSDPIRTVRIQAASVLADLPEAQLPKGFRSAFEDYLAEQRFNADRPEAQVNLGTALAKRGQSEDAMRAFGEAIALDHTFIPAFVNLADIYRSVGDEAASEKVLRDALAHNSSAAEAHYALGLSLVRQRRSHDALSEFAAATRFAPQVARYAYVQAVAVHDMGKTTGAIRLLVKNLGKHPFDRDTLSALALYSAETGRATEARDYAARLLVLEPNDPGVRALMDRLR